MKAKQSGTLFIVPTPIGNLEDMTLRAIRVLKEVDYIYAEDTRHSKKLLSHFGITTPLFSYYREKEEERSVAIIKVLEDGADVALITDAGTPAISDPGAILVGHAQEYGIRIVPLPGASATVTAMSASGLPGDGFLFAGFPPAKKGARKRFLESLKYLRYPVILYESPKRLNAMLKEALEILGDRQVFWARELTKKFEELQRTSLAELDLDSTREPRGESVVIIAPGSKEEVSAASLDELLVWHRDNTENSLKDVSRIISDDLGISRAKVYQQALTIWKK